jgi:hypothetical protein
MRLARLRIGAAALRGHLPPGALGARLLWAALRLRLGAVLLRRALSGGLLGAVLLRRRLALRCRARLGLAARLRARLRGLALRCRVRLGLAARLLARLRGLALYGSACGRLLAGGACAMIGDVLLVLVGGALRRRSRCGGGFVGDSGSLLVLPLVCVHVMHPLNHKQCESYCSNRD